MKILLVNQYYYPDIAATAQLCADLAEDLVRLGHQVTVVAGTATYRVPHQGPRALPRAALPLRDQHQGVRIHRVPVLQTQQRLGRVLGYGTFLATAALRVLREERPDVVLALSTPPLVAALGLLVKGLRGARFVYWVQDVYPELAVRLGVMGAGGAAARGFERLSRLLYQRADAVVALDPAMGAALQAAGAPPGRVHVIDNWCDGEEVRPQAPGDNPLRRHLGLAAEDFTVGYAGNLGLGHDFATVAAALPRLREDPTQLLFVGEGPKRRLLEDVARDQQLPRVRFLPPQARSGLRDALTAGDVGLVTMAEGLEGLLVPSKIYGLLAAGRPILYVGPPQGRAAELVEREGVGESVRNGDVDGLVAAVRRLQRDPGLRAAQGARARALFCDRYERRLCTQQHEALLRRVVEGVAP